MDALHVVSEKSKDAKTNRNRLFSRILFVLCVLFVSRVAGQLFVYLGLAPQLPPMSEWQSGLLPYPLLLFSQVAIIALQLRLCLMTLRGETFALLRTQRAAALLMRVGTLYFLSMPVRYIIYMYISPESRWFGGTIPIVFHMVLAAFLLVYSRFLQHQALNDLAVPSSGS